MKSYIIPSYVCWGKNCGGFSPESAILKLPKMKISTVGYELSKQIMDKLVTLYDFIPIWQRLAMNWNCYISHMEVHGGSFLYYTLAIIQTTPIWCQILEHQLGNN